MLEHYSIQQNKIGLVQGKQKLNLLIVFSCF
jgi:hypothetical protein